MLTTRCGSFQTWTTSILRDGIYSDYDRWSPWTRSVFDRYSIIDESDRLTQVSSSSSFSKKQSSKNGSPLGRSIQRF
jgi:hypothetical protein